MYDFLKVTIFAKFILLKAINNTIFADLKQIAHVHAGFSESSLISIMQEKRVNIFDSII